MEARVGAIKYLVPFFKYLVPFFIIDAAMDEKLKAIRKYVFVNH